MLARGILGSGWTRSVSFRPFPNSSGWWWLIGSVFLIRISCHKTTHANGYCGTWPGWVVSISVFPLTNRWLKLYILGPVPPQTRPLYTWTWLVKRILFSQFHRSVVSNSLDPMNRSMPGLPVHHQYLEFTHTHVPRVSDAIQPSRPRSSPSPPASNPSQHQSLFQWVNSSHEVAKVLELQL